MTSLTWCSTIFVLFLVRESASQATQCVDLPAEPGDRRASHYKLSVATYNTYWLFLDPTHSEGSIDCPAEDSSCPWHNESIAYEHGHNIADEIDYVSADLFGMQEVEDCWVLSQVKSFMSGVNQDDYEEYLILGTDTYTGENVGLFARIDPISFERTNEYCDYPVDSSTCGQGNKYTGSTGVSKNFIARFNIEHLPGSSSYLTLIVVHFLSGANSNDENCVKREAQATVIAWAVEEAANRGDHIIVMGDFNDYSSQVMDCQNDYPNSSAERIIRESANLQNVALFVDDQDYRYSYYYDKEHDCKDDGNPDHRMYDQMLVDVELFSMLEYVDMVHNYEGDCQHMYSDHWPVKAMFNFDYYEQNINQTLSKLKKLNDKNNYYHKNHHSP